MIRRCFVLVVLTLSCSAFSAADEPLLIKASDYPEGGGLKISASDAIVFDTQGFVFSAAHGTAFGPPDTIAVHCIGDENRGYYSMPYSSKKSMYRIDSEHLTPRGNPPFPGFEPGAAVFLMVGRELPEGSLDMGMFADQWTLNLRVER